MGFKFKNENGESLPETKSNSNSDSLFNSIAKKTPKQEQLALFKAVIKQMIAENQAPEAIIAFTKEPSHKTRYGIDKGSDLDAAFFGGIARYTTASEREQILLELDNE